MGLNLRWQARIYSAATRHCREKADEADAVDWASTMSLRGRSRSIEVVFRG